MKKIVFRTVEKNLSLIFSIHGMMNFQMILVSTKMLESLISKSMVITKKNKNLKLFHTMLEKFTQDLIKEKTIANYIQKLGVI